MVSCSCQVCTPHHVSFVCVILAAVTVMLSMSTDPNSSYARKFGFDSFNFHIEESLARNAFLRDSGCTKAVLYRTKSVSDDVWGSLSGGRFRNISLAGRSWSDRLHDVTSFSQLQLGLRFATSRFERSRALRFHWFCR